VADNPLEWEMQLTLHEFSTICWCHH